MTAERTTSSDDDEAMALVTRELTAAVQAAVAPLVERVAALETALAGARVAYRDLRAQVQGARVKARVESAPRLSVAEWNAALHSVREEEGLAQTAFVARAKVLARAEQLRAGV